MAQYKPMLLSSTFSACPLNGSGVSVVEALGSALIGRVCMRTPHSTPTSDHLHAWNVESASLYLPSPLRVHCQALQYPGQRLGAPEIQV
jgi:hypothetical protein